MELSKRLAAIGAMVAKGSRLADIGTDHGYLPIWLTERGILASAIAMDINEGPLLRAEAHVKEHGLLDKIVLRKSDGFAELLPGEADTAVIAGMGGLLTIRILEKGKIITDSLKSLILSPQSEVIEVRRYLLDHGFDICSEDMVFDEGKYYTIIKAGHASGEINPWSYIEKKYGRYLLRSGKAVVAEYLEKERNTFELILERLKEAGTEKAAERIPEVEKELSAVSEAIRIAGTFRENEEEIREAEE